MQKLFCCVKKCFLPSTCNTIENNQSPCHDTTSIGGSWPCAARSSIGSSVQYRGLKPWFVYAFSSLNIICKYVNRIYVHGQCTGMCAMHCDRMGWDVMRCNLMLCVAMRCYITQCNVMWCYAMSCYECMWLVLPAQVKKFVKESPNMNPLLVKQDVCNGYTVGSLLYPATNIKKKRCPVRLSTSPLGFRQLLLHHQSCGQPSTTFAASTTPRAADHHRELRAVGARERCKRRRHQLCSRRCCMPPGCC